MTIADTIYAKLKAAPPEVAREVLDFLESLQAKAAQAPGQSSRNWDEFTGTLAGSPTFEGEPVELQRKLRGEWNR